MSKDKSDMPMPFVVVDNDDDAASEFDDDGWEDTVVNEDNCHLVGSFPVLNGVIVGGNSVLNRVDFPVHIYLEPAAKRWSQNLTIHCDIPDFGVPRDREQFYYAVVTARMALALGEDIFVGCRGGLGRTGMFIACVYALAHDVSPEEAVRSVRTTYSRYAIETQEQVRYIQSFVHTYQTPTVGGRISRFFSWLFRRA